MVSRRYMIWIGLLLWLHFPATAQNTLSLTSQEPRQSQYGVISNFEWREPNFVFPVRGGLWHTEPTFRQLPTEQESALPFEITVVFDVGGAIYITDFSSDPVNITNRTTYAMIPAWSPDGTQIAFLSSDSHRTWNESRLNIMSLATGEVRLVSDLILSSETTLTWSPDGRYIAATIGTIFIVDVETGEAQGLLIDFGHSVNWLPDSSGLIFESRGSLFRIDADGENLQKIIHAPPEIIRPILSPATNDVVFASSYEHINGLYRVNLDDLTISRVVDLTGYGEFPHYWSPNGQYIAFGVFTAFRSEVDVPGDADVFITNSDGSGMQAITGNGTDSLIGWANDSQHVIYYEGQPSVPSGSYVAVNIFDGAKIRLSNATMDSMCSYGGCQNFSVRPSIAFYATIDETISPTQSIKEAEGENVDGVKPVSAP